MDALVKMPGKDVARSSRKGDGLVAMNQALEDFAPALAISKRYCLQWEASICTIGIIGEPRSVDTARKIHHGFLPALVEMDRTCKTLLDVMSGHPPVDRATALSMLNVLFAAIGKRKSDEESTLLLAAAANGFANRFQFPLVRRSKELPFGGSLDHSVTLKFGEQLREKIASAQTIGRVEMTEAAREQWAAVYSKLSAAQPGLLGAVVARGEAQVVRLALVYALLDGSRQIDVPHLEAALAVWEYCEASAAFVFGDLLGDPVADEIARAL
jgi:hypothetical protein